MITVKIRSDTARLDRIDRQVDGRVNATLQTIAEEIVHDINANWSGSSPSPVGSPPAVVTGELERSAHIEQARDRGRFTFGKIIQYKTAYSHVLETETYDPANYQYNRPFLEPAVLRAEPRFAFAWERLLDV